MRELWPICGWVVIGPDKVRTRHRATSAAKALRKHLKIDEFPGLGVDTYSPQPGRWLFDLPNGDGVTARWEVIRLPD